MKQRRGWFAVGVVGALVLVYAACLTLVLGLIEAGAMPRTGLALGVPDLTGDPAIQEPGATPATADARPADRPSGTRRPGTRRASDPTPAPLESRPTRSPPRVTATPAPPGPTLVPGVDWPALAEVGERRPQATTPHFEVFADDPEDALLNQAVERWAPELETLLARTSAQLDGRTLPTAPVQVVFTRVYDARCPARGLAATAQDPPLIMAFLDEDTTEVQIRAVLAHEMAHHITLDERFVGDGILTEGIANWAADDLMLAWQGYGSWDAAVRDYLAHGEYVSITDRSPLSPRAGEDCIARRDRVYNARTSFVDWLVRRVGLGTVLAMPYIEIETPASGSADGAEDSDEGGAEEAEIAATAEPEVLRVPDYEAATGLGLAELERLWLADVSAGARPEAD